MTKFFNKISIKLLLLKHLLFLITIELSFYYEIQGIYLYFIYIFLSMWHSKI